MKKYSYKIRAKVWLYKGMGAWHFVTLPKKQSAEIKMRFGLFTKGFGSIPVTVTVGTTSWKTSIFPDTKSSAYVLPLKKEVRAAENIKHGDTITFQLALS